MKFENSKIEHAVLEVITMCICYQNAQQRHPMPNAKADTTPNYPMMLFVSNACLQEDTNADSNIAPTSYTFYHRREPAPTIIDYALSLRSSHFTHTGS